jgi:hypothetical protein
VQLGVTEQTIPCELRHLGDGMARAAFLVQHDFHSLIGSAQYAAFDRNPALEVSQGLAQRAWYFDPPVGPIDIATSVSKNLQYLIAEPDGLNSGLTGRMHRFVEATTRELRLDHCLRRGLRILDIEVEQSQVKVAGLW